MTRHEDGKAYYFGCHNSKRREIRNFEQMDDIRIEV